MRRLTPILALALLACGEEGLDPAGYHWEVTVKGEKDACNPGEPVTYEETFVYSLYFEDAATELKINDETWATGTISGCLLSYESFQVGERRGPNDEYFVKWTLVGDATIRQGGSACDLDVDVDWSGTEVFTLDEASEDLGYPPDCTFTESVVGAYLGHGENL